MNFSENQLGLAMDTIADSAGTYYRNRRRSIGALAVGTIVAGGGFVLEQLNGEAVDPIGAAMLASGVSVAVTGAITGLIGRVRHEERVKSV